MAQSPPIIVAGMHRSGTTLVAKLLRSGGVAMGPSSRQGDHQEDVGFVEFHRMLLKNCVPADKPGWLDWGWTEDEAFDVTRADPFKNQAFARAHTRTPGGHWGWKDPRTTLFLDFWKEIIPGSRFLLVYRFPWEVADSMQRLGSSVFLRNAGYAHRIWRFYNERIVAFARANPDRCLLVSANAMMHRSDGFRELMHERFDVDIRQRAFARIYDRERFVSTDARIDPLVTLLAAASPASIQLLKELDDRADLSSAPFWNAGEPPALQLLRRPERTGSVSTSVIIPCFNHGELLLEAVASVERSVPAETTELIIVNDGSTEPRTLAVMAALKSLGYHVIDKENGGVAGARNVGIEAAAGRYILPLDADNRLLPGYVQQGTAVLDRTPATGVVYSSRRVFGGRNHLVFPPSPRFPHMCYCNRVDACALFRREVWNDCNGYDTNLDALEDWEFWIHAMIKGWKFHHLPDVLFEYRVRPGSMLRGAMHDDPSSERDRYIYTKHAAALRPWLGPGPGGHDPPHARLVRRLRRAWILRTYRRRGIRP
ncbi:MAG: glycosyltransferase [Gemmatimonadetes bacterium]|nr:glycosyltransferase [Gemmatimonadota bacterium]